MYLHRLILLMKLYRAVILQNNRALHQVWNELEHGKYGHALTQNKRLWQRVLFYTRQSCLTNVWFSTLHEHALSQSEQRLGIYMGIFTPVFDDLADESGYTIEHLVHLIEGKQHRPNNAQENLLIDSYIYMLKTIRSPERFLRYAYAVAKAQHRSLGQKASELTETELRQITDSKGGYATLLYRSLLDVPITEQEEKAVFELGGLLQYINDLFDVYRDSVAGVLTLPLYFGIPLRMREYFDEKERLVVEAFHNAAFRSDCLKHFFGGVNMIVGRGRVCLDNLHRVYDRKQLPVNALNYERSELICDMEKITNLVRSIFYIPNRLQ